MAAIQIDENNLPFVFVTHDGVCTDAEFEQYLESLRRSMYAANAGPRVMIIDATHSGATPATQRRRQADWMKEHADRIAMLTLGTAFIIPSSLIRGMLTAILWIQPLPCPHEVCATMDDALRWGASKLRERGLAAPPIRTAQLTAKRA